MNDVDPQAWLADVLARLPDLSRQQSRRPSALELEGEPAAQGRPCRLSDLHPKIAPTWGAGRVRTVHQQELRPKRRLQAALDSAG
ncbi:transposase domain-containing protein [Bradyrhizobium xenonodulans]|uniref:transposase domain-containing protein n=1 Tax=Bradyrhizobium xenonodulans TaxID=2736875 RepID=UPI003F8E6342